MSILTDHPINSVLKQILSFQEHEKLPERLVGLTADQRAGLDRIFALSRLLSNLLETSDPAEASLSGLEGLRANLQQAFAELSAYVSNGNQGHLTNALSSTDTAQTIAAWVFYNKPVRGAKPQFESVASVRNAALKAVEQLEAKLIDVATGADAFKTTSEERRQEVAALAQQMEAIRTQASSVASDLAQQAANDRGEAKAAWDDFLRAARDESDTLKSKVKSDGDKVLAEIGTLRDKAAEIVQIVGNIGVTGNYQNFATAEAKSANAWRFAAMACFIVGIAMVIGVLIHHLWSGEQNGLEVLVTRFAIAAVVTLPALYAANESSKHRRNAERAKETELKLASLSPFLATLPDDRRAELIEKLTPDYFGRSPDPTAAEGRKGMASEVDLTKLLGEVANIVSKAKA